MAERVFLAPVGGEEDLKLVDTNLALAGDTLDARLKTKVHVKAGPHDVAVAFLRRDSAESDEPLQPFTRDLDLQNMNGIPLIDHVQITGPLNATGPGDTPSRRRIFVCTPANAADEVPCAKKNPGDAGATGLPAAGHRRRHGDAAELLPGRQESGRFRIRDRERTAADAGESEVPVPVRARSGARRGWAAFTT